MSWLKKRSHMPETPKNSIHFNSGQQPQHWNPPLPTTSQEQNTGNNWNQQPYNNSIDWQNQQQNQFLLTQFDNQNRTNNNPTNAPIKTQSSPGYQNDGMTSQYFNSNEGWNDWNENSSSLTQQPAIQQQQQYITSSGEHTNEVQPNSISSPNQNSQFTSINQNKSFPQESNVSLYNPASHLAPSSIHQANQMYQPNVDYSSSIVGQQHTDQSMYIKNISNDSWNKNVESHNQLKTPDIVNNEPFHKISHTSLQKHLRNTNTGSNNLFESDLNIKQNHSSEAVIPSYDMRTNNTTIENIENLQTRLPDDLKNTQQLHNPNLTRVMRTDHQLTPQWSIESQVSQTSSDRSMESDNLDSRSSATNTSEDPNVGYGTNNENSNPENIQNVTNNIMFSDIKPVQSLPFNTHKPEADLDSLDQVLRDMNVIQSEQKRDLNFYQGGRFDSGNQDKSLPLPPPPLECVNYQNRMTNAQYLPHNVNSSQSNATQDPTDYQSRISNVLPPPSVSPAFLPNPMPIIAPPSLPTPQGSGNPFKRSGPPTHRSSLFNVIPTTNYYQENLNQETLTPDNSEVPIPVPGTINKNSEIENLEIAPSNERNQYLQTGHLSEDGYGVGAEIVPLPPDNNDNFPPPGLSRFVLGQPESENRQYNHKEPPPGFDRMVPGTSASNSERQADGQVSNFVTLNSRNTYMHPQHTENVLTESISITDRNLYLVPGESDLLSQRVVPGLEHDHSPSFVAQNDNDMPINEQRELVMDGENLDDQQQLNDIRRDEPIEGANNLDESLPISGNINSQEVDVNLELRRKEHSNPSTANDDSDKDRNLYYKSRRNDDVLKKRNKPKYDTEESDYYSDRDRKRYPREGSIQDGREGKTEHYKEVRDKDKHKDRKDGNGREKDKFRDSRDGARDRERERYEKDRNRERYDRRDRDRNNSRYETDGSKYDNDITSKYDRENKRRYVKDDKGRRIEEREENYQRDDKDKRYARSDRERDNRRRDDHRYKDDGEKNRRREREKDRRYDYDDTSYHRSGSRNASERDRDYEKNRGYPNYYGSAGYGYDHYSYYTQQQQYYENLRRTNPQAYAEWYRKYYSQMQTQIPGVEISNTDGRESVHSGRSSANDKERYNRSSQQQQKYYNPIDYHHHRQFPQSHSSTLIDHNLSGIIGEQQQPPYIIPSRSYYTQSEFSESRIDNMESSTHHLENASLLNQERSTPCKYTNEHCVGSLTSGLLSIVKPKYSTNGTTFNIVKIMNISINDGTRRLFQNYPGPLIRGVTHKKTIIEFCEDQLRNGPAALANVKSRGNSISSVYSLGQTNNRSSFVLMWNLLILLLRQNGMVVGTDISELLIKNQGEFPYEIQTTSNKTLSSRRNSVQSYSRRSRENQSPSEDNVDDDKIDDINRSISLEEQDNNNVNNQQQQLTEEEITEKFRNYLLYGNVNEALDWATDNNLWGHALFLASKVDRRSHANVMMKFANKLALNDPLQTLFQLMSGRIPSAVTSVQDEKWGDWRSHLAMILSNTSQKPDLDRKAITTLGDSLYNRGDLFGAQFCYIMAQVGFGKYTNVNQESALMFNSTNVIRLILLGSSHHKIFKEFATNEAIMMTEIYEYACALNDDKFSIVEFQPYKYLLATRMLDYGFQLKTLMYMEQITNHILKDPTKYNRDFIEKISILADRLKYHDPAYEKTIEDLNNTIDTTDQNVTYVGEQKWLQNLRLALMNQVNYSEVTDNHDGVDLYNTNIESLNYQPNQQSQEFINKNQIDQQFAELNQQFSELNMQYNSDNQQHRLQTQNQIQHGLGYVHHTLPPQQQGDIQNISTVVANETYGQNFYDPQEKVDQNQYSKINQPNNFEAGSSIDYVAGGQHYVAPPTVTENLLQQPTNNDYWNQMQLNSEIPKPSISMPNSMSNKPGFYDESPTTTTDTTNSSVKDTTKKLQQKDVKNQNQSTSTNSGWFGGIWNKLSLKPKNQMILPDDKNPAILWDPDKKKWVNKDHTEELEEEFKPPPKISDIGQSIGLMSNNNSGLNQTLNANDITAAGPRFSTQQGGVQTMTDINKTPNLQSNMFKMQRNRTLKNSYVDVFNPSGASTKSTDSIAPPPHLMPMVPQTGYFVPTANPTDPPQESGLQDGPQFYNPNQYTTAGATGYQQ